MSIIESLYKHARERPQALAATQDFERQITWHDLAHAVGDRAQALRARGVQKNDRCLLYMADGIDALIQALAVFECAAVHVPVDIHLPYLECQRVAHDLGARWLCTDEEGQWTLRALEADSTDSATSTVSTTDSQAFSQQVAACEDMAFIRYSSGTTGAAKGVVLTQSALSKRVHAAQCGLHLATGERVLWCLSMAYHFAVSICLYIEYGVTICFAQSLRASRMVKLAVHWQCTFAYLSPLHVTALTRLGSQHQFPASLQQVVSTTSALHADSARLFYERHQITLRQALGIIEVGLPFVSAGGVDEKVGSFGQVLPAYEVRIIAEGRRCSAGDAGELHIRGQGMFAAYWSPWQRCSDILTDGWFPTGDLAYQDASGAVFYCGRLKDIINVAGMKIFPAEVEAVVSTHAQVKQCRVYGAPDQRLGEHVAIDIVWRDAANTSTLVARSTTVLEEELRELCAQRLGSEACPAVYTCVDSLAMTPSGKVKRHSV